MPHRVSEVQVDASIAAAVAAERASSEAAAQQALAAQEATMNAAAASLDKQLRVAFSKATAEIARSSEELTSAMERRLDHFADVFQRAQAMFTALSEYATVQT
jgi:hypothetical protein